MHQVTMACKFTHLSWLFRVWVKCRWWLFFGCRSWNRCRRTDTALRQQRWLNSRRFSITIRRTGDHDLRTTHRSFWSWSTSLPHRRPSEGLRETVGNQRGSRSAFLTETTLATRSRQRCASYEFWRRVANNRTAKTTINIKHLTSNVLRTITHHFDRKRCTS